MKESKQKIKNRYTAKRKGQETEPQAIRTWKRRRGLMLVITAVWLVSLVAGSVYYAQDYKARLEIHLGSVRVPRWVKQEFLTPNPDSRPQTPLARVNRILVRDVPESGTSSKQNWNYLNGPGGQEEGADFAGSHFIIGMDGEIIQAIPLDETAHAASKRYNSRTISIACCYPDDTGEITAAAYEALVKLTSWLCAELRLDEKDVIRLYDATGRQEPKYYVEHKDAWKAYRSDVRRAVRESRE